MSENAGTLKQGLGWQTLPSERPENFEINPAMMAWSRHVLAWVRQLELNWSKFKIQAYPLFTMSVIIAPGPKPRRETVFFFCMDI